MFGGSLELELISTLKEALRPESLEPLIEPVLTTLRNSFNTRSNRLILINFLFQVRAQLSEAQADTICRTLLVFAEGQEVGTSPADQMDTSTVARFTMKGTPSSAAERGGAIVALAFIAADRSCPTSEIICAITAGLLDPEAEVRQSAYRALAALGELSTDQTAYLLAGMQDRDVAAACSAIASIRLFVAHGLLSNHTFTILVVCRHGASSESPALRHEVALLIKAIARNDLPTEAKDLLKATYEILKFDIHFSVRSALCDYAPSILR